MVTKIKAFLDGLDLESLLQYIRWEVVLQGVGEGDFQDEKFIQCLVNFMETKRFILIPHEGMGEVEGGPFWPKG